MVTVLFLIVTLAGSIQQHECPDSSSQPRKDAEAKPKSLSREAPAAPFIKPKPVSRGYAHIVAKTAGRYRVDPRLIHAVIQIESKGNPAAVSPMGAKGLMQLMPAVCAKYNVWNPFDMEQNIRGGTAYLAYLVNFFKGDAEKALAAYNCGLKRVIENNGVPPGPAADFVRKILGRYEGPVVCELPPIDG